MISETLYADLPDFKILSEYKKMGEDTLIHRYNCAQIQGLLIRSKKITFLVKGASYSSKKKINSKTEIFRAYCGYSCKVKYYGTFRVGPNVYISGWQCLWS